MHEKACKKTFPLSSRPLIFKMRCIAWVKLLVIPPLKRCSIKSSADFALESNPNFTPRNLYRFMKFKGGFRVEKKATRAFHISYEAHELLNYKTLYRVSFLFCGVLLNAPQIFLLYLLQSLHKVRKYSFYQFYYLLSSLRQFAYCGDQLAWIPTLVF